MKKLMILGGARYILPLIEIAHKLNIYVITADYLPDNVAHKYSDEYCNVSIIEKEKVLEKAKELNIDGIMSFACDPGVETAAYVAEKMNLPNVGPYESVQILQNKGKFRKFLKENNFNVPNSKAFTNAKDIQKYIEDSEWPVIVKPTDSAGSKGVTKVLSEDGLEKAINYALKYSKGHEFIIEDFLDKKDCSSDCDAFVIDGKIKSIYFSAQRFDKSSPNEYVPAAYSWPSTICHENIKYLTNEIQRLITLLGMKTGVYNIETRECTNGKSYIMECSPRGGGNRLSEMIKYMTDVDFLEASLRASLNMKLNPISQTNISDNWAEIILHSDKEGVFKEVYISDDLDEYVIEKDLWIKSGDRINSFLGANDAIGTIIINFKNNVDLMNKVVNNISKYIYIVLK